MSESTIPSVVTQAITSAVAAEQTRATNSENYITSLVTANTTAIGVINNANDANTTAITGLTATVGGNTNSIAAIETQLSGLVFTSGSQASAFTNLNAQFTALNNTVAGHNASIITLNNEYTAINTNITSLNNNVGALGSQYTALSDALSGQTVNLNGVSNTVNSLTTTVNNHSTAITNLTTQLSTISGVSGNLSSIATLNNQFAALNTTVTGHTTSIAALNTQYTTLAATVSGYGPTIGTLTTEYSSLNSTVSGNTTAINTLNTTVATQQTTVSTLGTTVNNNSAAITALNNQYTSQATNITANATAITTEANRAKAAEALLAPLTGATLVNATLTNATFSSNLNIPTLASQAFTITQTCAPYSYAQTAQTINYTNDRTVTNTGGNNIAMLMNLSMPVGSIGNIYGIQITANSHGNGGYVADNVLFSTAMYSRGNTSANWYWSSVELSGDLSGIGVFDSNGNVLGKAGYIKEMDFYGSGPEPANAVWNVEAGTRTGQLLRGQEYTGGYSWAANTVYAIGAIVQNCNVGSVPWNFVCITAGTSGATQPTWTIGTGATAQQNPIVSPATTSTPFTVSEGPNTLTWQPTCVMAPQYAYGYRIITDPNVNFVNGFVYDGVYVSACMDTTSAQFNHPLGNGAALRLAPGHKIDFSGTNAANGAGQNLHTLSYNTQGNGETPNIGGMELQYNGTNIMRWNDDYSVEINGTPIFVYGNAANLGTQSNNKAGYDYALTLGRNITNGTNEIDFIGPSFYFYPFTSSTTTNGLTTQNITTPSLIISKTGVTVQSSLPLLLGTTQVLTGVGIPTVSAVNGSVYFRTDGGAGTRFYINESGVSGGVGVVGTTWAAVA